MIKYILQRVLFMVPAALLVATLTFSMFHLVPGDPARLVAGDKASYEALQAVRRRYGFDKPIYVQYFKYINRLIQGDLGRSLFNRSPVGSLLLPKFFNTFKLVGLSMAVAISISMVLGPLAAYYYGSSFDRILMLFSMLGISTPVFVLGLGGLLLFSVKLDLLPVGGMGAWPSYILPTMSLGIYQSAHLIRMVRNCVADVMSSDYIRTAKAKGLSETMTLYKHGMKNAMLPIITIIGLQFGYLLAGAIVAETVFTWPGLGRLLMESIGRRDLPVTQGALMLGVIVFISINLIVDILYTAIDPTIKYD